MIMPFNPSLLRVAIFCLVITVMLSSCSNNGSSGGGNPVNNSYLASARNVTSESLLIDSFSYDAQKKVARYTQIMTSRGGSDTVTFSFGFSGSNTLPDSYVITENGNFIQTHQLTFDGQGRIAKDTCISTGFVTHYVYSGNYIVCNILFQGTLDDAQIDTLVVTDGNITAEKVWGLDNGTKEKQGDITFGHAAAANPGYKVEIANSVGPLLYVLSTYNYGGYSDFISKSIITKIGGTADGLPPGGMNYTVHTDATGRVSSITPTGAGVPSGIATAFTYY